MRKGPKLYLVTNCASHSPSVRHVIATYHGKATRAVKASTVSGRMAQVTRSNLRGENSRELAQSIARVTALSQLSASAAPFGRGAAGVDGNEACQPQVRSSPAGKAPGKRPAAGNRPVPWPAPPGRAERRSMRKPTTTPAEMPCRTDWQSVLRRARNCRRLGFRRFADPRPLGKQGHGQRGDEHQGRVDRCRPGRDRENDVRGRHQSGPKTDFGREQPPRQVIGCQGRADRQDRRGQACGKLARRPGT